MFSQLEGQIVALLVQNVERLDENVKEEADGVHNTLGTIENMTELRPGICVSAGEQGLIAWLLKRLRVRCTGCNSESSSVEHILCNFWFIYIESTCI